MLKYLPKRILVFIPTLFIITLLAFIISINAPGDPAEKLTNAASSDGAANVNSASQKQEKQRIRKRLGLDKPIFYFVLVSAAESDTLYRVEDLSHQDNLKNLTHLYGNWEEISKYYLLLNTCQQKHMVFTRSALDSIYTTNFTLSDSIKIFTYSKNEINDAVNKLDTISDAIKDYAVSIKNEASETISNAMHKTADKGKEAAEELVNNAKSYSKKLTSHSLSKVSDWLKNLSNKVNS